MKEIKKLKDNDLEKVAGGAGEGSNIADRAMAEIGKPYEWGACGPASYDASGLVSYAVTGSYVHSYTYSTLMLLPRVNDPQPGDICVNCAHCGIYIGNGKMIHVQSVGDRVHVSSVPGGMVYVRV